jgi:hypothetical protein
VRFFIHSSSYCKLYQRIRGTFWSYVYQRKNCSYNYSLLCLLVEKMKMYVYDLNDNEYHPNLSCLSLLYECNFILILIPP